MSSQLCQIICFLHCKVYYCINNQTRLQTLRGGGKKMFCHKLGAFCQSFYAKKGSTEIKVSQKILGRFFHCKLE